MTDVNSFTLLYDGLCPVCAREVAFLRRRDRRGALAAVDIAAPGFAPERYGVTLAECVGTLHAIDAQGRALRGMDAIRAMYEAVGLGRLVRWTGRRPFRSGADLAYAAFARIRPKLSRFRPADCHDGRCDVGPRKP